MSIHRIIYTPLLALTPLLMDAELVAHYDMSLHDGAIRESVSGQTFAVEGNFTPENVAGAVGQALRFDGYTSHVKARTGNIIQGSKTATISCWVAVPCYPIIQVDTETAQQTPIMTCLDETGRAGFGFYLGFNGKYSFKTYIGGWPVTIEAKDPLPVYQWNNLVAVIDSDARSIKLYNNGEEVGSGRANGNFSINEADFYLGQSTDSRMFGPFELMSFNGLIDDISIWNTATPQATIQGWKAENEANLDIPKSRFEGDRLRPRFHGMPAAGWTNECHGLVYADGKYHLFFQKNADGPYMARLHWGHITSENLYKWEEEDIAIAPGDWYDIKGCWSGCVFTDDAITGGKPNIIYTAVDYVKAMIAKAEPLDDGLVKWSKYSGNPIINGRPSGLSDDFRDPYFFRSGDNAYIIVGSSKNGVGTTTLHRYNPLSGSWSNTGELFFTGTSASTCGTFWEMPNATQMPDGKWLVTTTPIGTSQGVRTLYWTGSIADNGTFVPDGNSKEPRLLEMNSRQGFGLLSPTVYNHNGKTIALGIVPDKLPAVTNWNLGWAHCYSLPREWSLNDDGNLVQKPAESLTGLRTPTMFSRSDFELNGSQSITPVSGRAVEISATFAVGSSEFGFKFFKNASSEATLTYKPSTGEIVVDFSSLPRLINDGGVYDGVYRLPLPQRPAAGGNLKINLFIDHSILDIFINDMYASSIRVFPTQDDAEEIEVFSTENTTVRQLNAWILDADASSSGIDMVFPDNDGAMSDYVDVYSLQGVRLRTKVHKDTAADSLPQGVYIIGGRKTIVR